MAITISCASPPGGTVGVFYAHAFPVTGSTGAYTYSISTGALPPGLTLDPSSGSLTGVPTAPGTYFFSVKAQQ